MAAVKEFAFILWIAGVMLTKKNVTAVVTGPIFVRSPLRLFVGKNEINKTQTSTKRRKEFESIWPKRSWDCRMKKCLKSFVEMVPQHEEVLERVIGWSWHGRHAVRQRHPNKPVDDLIRWYKKKTRWKKQTNRSCSFHKWKKECLSRCWTEREKTGYQQIPEIQRVDFHWSLETLLLIKMDDSVSKTELRSYETFCQ